MPAKPPVYLIDAPIYVFRAYYAIPPDLTDRRGRPANAVYGYTRFLCALLRDERPDYVAAAFDESLTSSFRNQWYAHYKANRVEPPQQLADQFAACRRVTRALGVRTFVSPRYEADDLIATAARRAHRAGHSVVVLSRDKDLAQVLGPGDRLWDGADGPRMSPAMVERKLGVRPGQVADYLALVGDAVDNIPGVPGIGPKAAAAVLAVLGDLDGIFADLDAVARLRIRRAARVRDLLEAHEDRARLSLRLARLDTGSRIRCEPERLRWEGPTPRRVRRAFAALGFGEGLEARCLGQGPD
ncbi:MAG: 5'-3' exonuclease H3TH domain-containing protein [Chromatiales bacterium]|jgi:5'-3' exonuclease